MMSHIPKYMCRDDVESRALFVSRGNGSISLVNWESALQANPQSTVAERPLQKLLILG